MADKEAKAQDFRATFFLYRLLGWERETSSHFHKDIEREKNKKATPGHLMECDGEDQTASMRKFSLERRKKSSSKETTVERECHTRFFLPSANLYRLYATCY